MKTIITYVSILISFAVFDSLWLALIAKDFYAKQLGFLFAKSVNFIPVLVFYPLYSLGVLLLAVIPALNSGSWLEALWRGALIGLIAYAAYDLTNHATIANWPTVVTIVDIAWGAFVTASVSLVSYFVINLIYT